MQKSNVSTVSSFLLLIILFSFIFISNGTVTILSQVGVNFNDSFTIECTISSLIGLSYSIQVDNANYSVELFAVVDSVSQLYSQNCNLLCNATYPFNISNCLIRILCSGSNHISYSIIQNSTSQNQIFPSTYSSIEPYNIATPALSGGAIAGIVIGSVIGLLILMTLAFFGGIYCCCNEALSLFVPNK